MMMMVYIVTVTYFQVDSTVYVSDDGLYCTVTYFQVDSTVYVSDKSTCTQCTYLSDENCIDTKLEGTVGLVDSTFNNMSVISWR